MEENENGIHRNIQGKTRALNSRRKNHQIYEEACGSPQQQQTGNDRAVRETARRTYKPRKDQKQMSPTHGGLAKLGFLNQA